MVQFIYSNFLQKGTNFIDEHNFAQPFKSSNFGGNGGRFEKYSVPNNVLSYFKKNENPIQIDFSRYNKFGVKVCIC